MKNIIFYLTIKLNIYKSNFDNLLYNKLYISIFCVEININCNLKKP